jgi:alpha-L-arabinofuranosidase
MTVSIVNRHLYDEKPISLSFAKGAWRVAKADIVTTDNVRACNSFEEPFVICDRAFAVTESSSMVIPPHSVVRICLTKA